MRILICDDHEMLRNGIQRDLEIVFPKSKIDGVGCGSDALDLLSEQTYDVVVLDLELPDGDGFDMLQQIKTRFPYVRVLIFSYHDYPEFAAKAIKAGALSYLNKSIKPALFMEAIKSIYDGKLFMPEDKMHLVSDSKFEHSANLPHFDLSPCEIRIAYMLANGKKYEEISELVHISQKTVGTHRSNIMKKMKMRKNTELTRYFMQHKLLSEK